MSKAHVKTLMAFEKAAIYGIGTGLLLIVFSFFVNGYIMSYILATGIGIVIASIFALIIGISFSLMEEHTLNSKGHDKSYY
jgi:hypothetical protein